MPPSWFYIHFYIAKRTSPAHPDRCRKPAYAGTVRAWHLRDGRWLIHRIIIHHGERARARGFFSLSPFMPR